MSIRTWSAGGPASRRSRSSGPTAERHRRLPVRSVGTNGITATTRPSTINHTPAVEVTGPTPTRIAAPSTTQAAAAAQDATAAIVRVRAEDYAA